MIDNHPQTDSSHNDNLNQDIYAVKSKTPKILVLSSYPPIECGIATYTSDLVNALRNQFGKSFETVICAVENDMDHVTYNEPVHLKLNSGDPQSYVELKNKINTDPGISMMMIQHEFGLYRRAESAFLEMLEEIKKPIAIVFHTVLSAPDEDMLYNVKRIAAAVERIIVLTQTSSIILEKTYGIEKSKINIIRHGTHLIVNRNTMEMKQAYGLNKRLILSTFGLISSGKSIETTIRALPEIAKKHPEVLFLVIGKTHPVVFKEEGDKYIDSLKELSKALEMENHIHFINRFLPLEELLDYLQMTDVYLFTSNNPNQAVSGTFTYALGCGCPIVSTPIPHALEVLQKGYGKIIDFNSDLQLSVAVNELLDDEESRNNMRQHNFQTNMANSWENTAIAHTLLFKSMLNDQLHIQYSIPPIKLDHLNRMTNQFGMYQFSHFNTPDQNSGYTLDDNARALLTVCLEHEYKQGPGILDKIEKYLKFIAFCQKPDGSFNNYVDENKKFPDSNNVENLEDSNGRAIWALGYLAGMSDSMPQNLRNEAEQMITKAASAIENIHSTRAMAFAIKGLCFGQARQKSKTFMLLIDVLGKRLVNMYSHESDSKWKWFESYLTYANSAIPQSLLLAYMVTGDNIYKTVARTSFDFFLKKVFTENRLSVIPNEVWLHKGSAQGRAGAEQPIDVAYTIFALETFAEVFPEMKYDEKMQIAFSWFLGNNHLNQTVYNPITGGCYDGLETENMNMNQGAESTLCYLLSRLTIQKTMEHTDKNKSTYTLSEIEH
ncbi:MAG TPA: glycosyltransferase [Bacteroidia bacterium]